MSVPNRWVTFLKVMAVQGNGLLFWWLCCLKLLKACAYHRCWVERQRSSESHTLKTALTIGIWAESEGGIIQLLCVLVQGRKYRKPTLDSSPSYFLKTSFGNNEVELLNNTSLLCLFLNSFRTQRRRAMNDYYPPEAQQDMDCPALISWQLLVLLVLG